MRIATYNVNGINGRLPSLLAWLKEAAPNVVCLQELKAPDDKFPEGPIRAAGYGAIWHGQESWNGVAILARGAQPVEIRRGLPGEVRGRDKASDHAPAWIDLAEPTKVSPGRARRLNGRTEMTAADRFNLERFVTAQAPVFETVLAELRADRKRSHWMWFVFPQLAGLGRSSTARFYGISSIDEARAYLAHPLLGPRLDLCTRIVLASESPSLHAMFGSPDDLKFRSCMTLFSLAADDADNPFRQALDRWCGGQPDEQTLAIIDAGG